MKQNGILMMKQLTFSVWGVRGSFPAAAADFLEYGGNTSCFSLRCGNSLVVFDAGSGLAALGDHLARGNDAVADVHILLSHAHIDHVMGLFSFLSRVGHDLPLHIYGGAALDSLEGLVGRPYWPYSLRDSGAILHRITPGKPFRLAEGERAARLSSMEGSHPGGCLWYRLDYDGRSVVYMLDCEVDRDRWTEMVRFAQSASLLVWDASFPPGEEKPGWGHSSWRHGVAFGQAAGAERVLMAHYADQLDDRMLKRLEHSASGMERACVFAKERREIEL